MGEASVYIHVPGSPRGKGRPRFTRGGIAFTDAKTRNSEAFIKLVASEAMAGRKLLEGPLRATLLAYFDVPKSMPKRDRPSALDGSLRPTKKPDADNILKLIDALNGVVFKDDSQIVEASIRKFYAETPRLEIYIVPMGAA